MGEPTSTTVQPADVRVNRANFLRRIGRLCFAAGTHDGLPAPQAVTHYDRGAGGGARLDFDTVADAEMWVDRYELAEVRPPTGNHAYFATVNLDGVDVELVVWADEIAEVQP